MACGEINISPFLEANVNPNSYNLRLGDELAEYCNDTLDVSIDNPMRRSVIPTDGVVLRSDRIYLGHTVEFVGSDHFVPILRARSSTARLGLFVHVTADLIDLGSLGQLCLQLHAVQPIRLLPGMAIAQVTFWEPRGERVLYNGKYQASKGSIGSRSYLDWHSE